MHGILFPKTNEVKGIVKHLVKNDAKPDDISEDIKPLLEILKLPFTKKLIEKFINDNGGRIVACGMAFALRFVFLVIFRNTYFHKDEAKEIFLENFEIEDDTVDGGKRYYDGKFLFRTDHPDDDMNVLLKFCRNPDKVLDSEGYVIPEELVFTTTLTEAEAKEIEEDPDKVDFVIYFKDVVSMFGMLSMGNLDPIIMLMENVMHVKGNAGQIGKFGAIAMNIIVRLKAKGVPIPI